MEESRFRCFIKPPEPKLCVNEEPGDVGKLGFIQWKWDVEQPLGKTVRWIRGWGGGVRWGALEGPTHQNCTTPRDQVERSGRKFRKRKVIQEGGVAHLSLCLRPCCECLLMLSAYFLLHL